MACSAGRAAGSRLRWEDSDWSRASPLRKLGKESVECSAELGASELWSAAASVAQLRRAGRASDRFQSARAGDIELAAAGGFWLAAPAGELRLSAPVGGFRFSAAAGGFRLAAPADGFWLAAQADGFRLTGRAGGFRWVGLAGGFLLVLGACSRLWATGGSRLAAAPYQRVGRGSVWVEPAEWAGQ